MKKVLVLVTALLLVGVVSLSAKPINVFVNGGMAFSDFEGAFIDLGAEMQIKGNIWGQVLIDSYLSPSGVDLPAGADESAVGITGAGRVTENVALYFGVASDIDGDEVGGKVGMSYQW